MAAISEKYTYWVEDHSYDDDCQWKISFVPFRRDMENKTTLRLFPEHLRLETIMEADQIIEQVEYQDKKKYKVKEDDVENQKTWWSSRSIFSGGFFKF